jgi:hypothetical protein
MNPIGVGFLSILISFSAMPVSAQTFTAHNCEDTKKVVEEIIDLEVSGTRWQAKTSRCLNQSRFETVFAKHRSLGDEYLLAPEYTLKKGSEVKVISQKSIPALDAVEVQIGYLASKDGKESFIKDRFVYRLNYGRNRMRQGCVTLIEELEHFVMKEECLK